MWTREDVAARILAGDTIVILHGRVIRVPDSWLAAHPGGPLAIQHFVGRDASDEALAYHSPATLNRMNAYALGSVHPSCLPWYPLVPPVMAGWVRRPRPDGTLAWHQDALAVRSLGNADDAPSSQILLYPAPPGPLSAPTRAALEPPPPTLSLPVQAAHSAAYKLLHKRVSDAGLFHCRWLSGYGPECIRYLALAFLSFLAYRHACFLTSAFFLGLFWHQVTFTVHDLAHQGGSHIWALDRFLAISIANFMGGLSVSWWNDNHNIHHLVTNHPSHDPDIEHMPFFAITRHFLSSLYSSYYKRWLKLDLPAQYLLRYQHYYFYFVMGLARLNLYFRSYAYLLKNIGTRATSKRERWAWWMEIVGIVFFWSWLTRVLRGCPDTWTAVAYFLICNVTASPLHVQIVLSHFSRSTADLGPLESFPHRQLRTTTDVICHPSLAFLHGGLDLQVTHHLFPRMPRHNLLAASKLVKEFAKDQNLEYFEFGFLEGNGEVRSTLRRVAEQVKLIGMVAQAEVQEAVEKIAVQ